MGPIQDSCRLSTPEYLIMHLLFYCPFAKKCWGPMNFRFADHLSIQQIFQAWKSLVKVEFSLDIFILLCWAIWMIKNDVIFRNKNPCKIAKDIEKIGFIASKDDKIRKIPLKYHGHVKYHRKNKLLPETTILSWFELTT